MSDNSNPWFQRPDDINEQREIEGQLCIWDNDPLDHPGQFWIPVCPECWRGPLNEGQRYCHGTECKVECAGCRYCKVEGWNDDDQG